MKKVSSAVHTTPKIDVDEFNVKYKYYEIGEYIAIDYDTYIQYGKVIGYKIVNGEVIYEIGETIKKEK